MKDRTRAILIIAIPLALGFIGIWMVLSYYTGA